MTLTEFLLARYAEDEAVARRCQVRRSLDIGLSWMDDSNEPWLLLDVDAAAGGDPVVSVLPVRVIADVEAKRRIVARLQMSQMLPVQISDHAADAILRALALPYADHPDYREVWKP